MRKDLVHPFHCMQRVEQYDIQPLPCLHKQYYHHSDYADLFTINSVSDLIYHTVGADNSIRVSGKYGMLRIPVNANYI